MALRQRSKFEATHAPRCSLLRRSPSASRSLRKLSEPTMVATCDGLMFVFIAPAGPCLPSPGSDQSLPPGSVGLAAPGFGAGVWPGAPPGGEGVNAQLPPGDVSTSGDGGGVPPGVSCGCTGAPGDSAAGRSLPGAFGEG